MALIHTYKCDNCGAVKQEVNHWWVARVENSGFWCVDMQSLTETEIKTGISLIHLCGTRCVIETTDKWMTERLGKNNETENKNI